MNDWIDKLILMRNTELKEGGSRGSTAYTKKQPRIALPLPRNGIPIGDSKLEVDTEHVIELSEVIHGQGIITGRTPP